VLLLVLSVVGLAFVLNGLRPLRFVPLFAPAFFASWLVVELAPQLLVITVVGVSLTAVLGGLHGLAWLGLGLAAVAAAGLLAMVVAMMPLPLLPALLAERRAARFADSTPP